MKKYIYLLLLLLLSYNSQAQEETINSILSTFPNSTYKEINTDSNTYYILKIRQPINHLDTLKGFFFQKVYLSHKSFKKPTVIITSGYNVNRNYEFELTKLLDANQIIVEHRYFGESIPDSLDYQYLNLKQATADLHRIKELFSTVYTNKWVSTGVSKGGATTIFYRYFYPNDVDVSVPYVAPINQSYEEPRIYDFLDTVGTDECRLKIRNFQIHILENRAKIIPLLKFYSIGANAKFSNVSLGEAFEYAVMEYPFSFWQWGHDCNNIPKNSASIEEITKHFIRVSDIRFFSDQTIQQLGPHYYQSATEMGYYGYETSKFKEYLKEIPTGSNPMCLFFPFDMTDKYDGKLLNDLNLWLKTQENKFIYIYGQNDTWSASAVPPSKEVNSHWFIMKGKHHGNARINSMTATEQTQFISILEKWLSIEIAPIEKDN